MACLLMLGELPAAQDPDNPTPGEEAAIEAKLADYQRIFDAH
jgi:hypothetical protein